MKVGRAVGVLATWVGVGWDGDGGGYMGRRWEGL